MYLDLYLSVKGIVSLLLRDTRYTTIIFRKRSSRGICAGPAFIAGVKRQREDEREQRRERRIYLRIVSPIESIFDEAVSLPATGFANVDET